MKKAEREAILIKRLAEMKRYENELYASGIKYIAGVEKDFVTQIFITTTHHYLLFFTNRGRVLRLKTYEIPENSSVDRKSVV